MLVAVIVVFGNFGIAVLARAVKHDDFMGLEHNVQQR
jgi:hypothetical protein